METTTVIELFEELKKQIAALGRRLDDRNPPAPPVSSIPTNPSNGSTGCWKPTELTRTNVERALMELTDRISALEKKFGQERGRCAAETGLRRSAFAAAAYPHHRLQILEIDALHVRALARRRLLRRTYPSAARPHRQHVRRRTEIPIHQDEGEASSERIAELEDIFEWNRDDDKIRQMKKNVEQYERTIQQRIALDEQIRLKGQEAEQLDEKAKKLRGK